MKKIAVYVLNGFLGSGKTTVLLKMIEQYKQENKKVAVILNELGTVNVETHLFKDQQLIELLNGCICCTIQDDLLETLKALVVQHEKENIDVLLIEGTGVAHPLEIAEVFAFEDLEAVFEIESIIGIVDASHFLDYLSIFSSSKEIRTLLREQVRHSSIILLNKIDCVDDKQFLKIRKKVDSLINDRVPVMTATYGDIHLEEIPKKRFGRIESLPSTSSHPHHHLGSHHGTIKMVKIEYGQMVDKRILTTWLNNLPKEVIRAKGLIQFTGDSHLTHVQFADKLVRYTAMDINDERKPMFVFIGKDISKEMFQDFPHRIGV
jgi:G3E family GTPase